MKQYRFHLSLLGLLLIVCAVQTWLPGAIIPAIVPSAVPVPNKTASGTVRFLICDVNENCVIKGGYSSGNGSGATGSLALTGGTSGSTVTLTVGTSTTAGTLTLPGVTGNLPAINGTPTPGDCANWFSAVQLGDAGAACGSGGGGGSGGSGFTVYSGLAGIALTGTTFFPFGGGNPASTTESVVQVGVQAAATFAKFGANLSVALGTTLGTNNSVALTFRKNGSSQTLTCTITNPATSCADTTHSFTTAANDLIDVQAVFTGTISATPVFLMSVQVGAGGGISTNTGSIASLPAAGTAGNLYFATDSLYEALRDNGLTWDYFYRGMKVTPPGGLTWAWNNQGSSVATQQTNGVLSITCPSNGASDNIRSYEFAAPSTPWTRTFRLHELITSINFNNAGLSLRESAKGKLVTMFATYNNSSVIDSDPIILGVDTWNSVSSHNANLIKTNLMIAGTTELTLQITDQGVGGNLLFNYSIDNGVTFLPWFSQARTAFFTTGPDFVGIAANPNNQSGTAPNNVTLVSVQ